VVKLALIGAGYWGEKWYRTLGEAAESGFRGPQLVAIVDPNERNIARLGDPSCKHAATVEEALACYEADQFDAAIVATPASTHVPLVLDLLERGKHVLVEKPPSLSIDGLAKLCHASRTQDRLLMVGLTYLHHPGIAWLAEQINSDIQTFGEPLYARCRWTNDGIVRDDVDVIWNVMPHPLSILLSLFGRDQSTRVVGVDRRDFLKRGRNDYAMVQLDIGGCQVSIEVSWLDMKKRRDVWVQGSNMAVWFDETGRNVEAYRGTMPAESMNWSASQGVTPLERELRRFVGAIENGTDCITPIDSPVVSEMVYLLSQIGGEKWEVWRG
jgi:predicted dehydrogenase